VRSGLATFDEDWSRVRQELSEAFRLLEQAGLGGYAAAACYRLAGFENGARARELAAIAEQRFQHLELVCPERALQVFSPGLYERDFADRPFSQPQEDVRVSP
jgi:hypothetical protein